MKQLRLPSDSSPRVSVTPTIATAAVARTMPSCTRPVNTSAVYQTLPGSAVASLTEQFPSAAVVTTAVGPVAYQTLPGSAVASLTQPFPSAPVVTTAVGPAAYQTLPGCAVASLTQPFPSAPVVTTAVGPAAYQTLPGSAVALLTQPFPSAPVVTKAVGPAAYQTLPGSAVASLIQSFGGIPGGATVVGTSAETRVAPQPLPTTAPVAAIPVVPTVAGTSVVASANLGPAITSFSPLRSTVSVMNPVMATPALTAGAEPGISSLTYPATVADFLPQNTFHGGEQRHGETVQDWLEHFESVAGLA